MIGATVYTVNNKRNVIDEWICNGEFTGTYHGVTERLCFLSKDKRKVILPKRCIFLSKDEAQKILNKK